MDNHHLILPPQLHDLAKESGENMDGIERVMLVSSSSYNHLRECVESHQRWNVELFTPIGLSMLFPTLGK